MLYKLCFICFFIGLVLFLACSKGDKVAKPEVEVFQEKVDEGKAKVKEIVSNPEKQEQILTLVDDNAEIILKYYEQRLAFKKQGYKLTSNYDATMAEFEEFLNNYNQDFEVFITRMIKNRNSMRKLMTDEEWDAVNEYFVKAND